MALPPAVHAVVEVGAYRIQLCTLVALDKFLARLPKERAALAAGEEQLCGVPELALADLQEVTGVGVKHAGAGAALLKALGLPDLAKRFSKVTTRRKA
eukprot:6417107-Lingulodinium_polyedra.AAC.1